MSTSYILVVSPVDPHSLQLDENGNVVVTEAEQLLDATDDFNHPRLRRALILQQLLKMKEDKFPGIQFQVTESMEAWTDFYKDVHSKDFLEFLSTAWDSWTALGGEGKDLPGRKTKSGFLMVPLNMPLHRDSLQRSSKHILGRMGYYCTDFATPIFASLVTELARDAAAVQAGVDAAVTTSSQTVYILPTHPGHHASKDVFGGYCYANTVAAAARRFQNKHGHARVAILDVDYHVRDCNVFCFISFVLV